MVSFCGILHFPHPKVKNIKRCSRLVVLPDYQGVGIGNKMLEFIANLYLKMNYRFTIITSSPALLYSFKKNPYWKLKHIGHKHKSLLSGRSCNRLTTSWEYIK